jgi:hypothetical protein
MSVNLPLKLEKLPLNLPKEQAISLNNIPDCGLYFTDIRSRLFMVSYSDAFGSI